MVSIFPSLLTYEELAPFLIRLVLAAVFIYWAYSGLRNPLVSVKDKSLAAVEGIAGIMVLVGIWTQIAAVILSIDLLGRIFFKIKSRQFLTSGVNYYLILLVLALSLLVTGSGWFSFDLPL